MFEELDKSVDIIVTNDLGDKERGQLTLSNRFINEYNDQYDLEQEENIYQIGEYGPTQQQHERENEDVKSNNEESLINNAAEITHDIGLGFAEISAILSDPNAHQNNSQAALSGNYAGVR